MQQSLWLTTLTRSHVTRACTLQHHLPDNCAIAFLHRCTTHNEGSVFCALGARSPRHTCAASQSCVLVLVHPWTRTPVNFQHMPVESESSVHLSTLRTWGYVSSLNTRLSALLVLCLCLSIRASLSLWCGVGSRAPPDRGAQLRRAAGQLPADEAAQALQPRSFGSAGPATRRDAARRPVSCAVRQGPWSYTWIPHPLTRCNS